jgi:hypothetical protein
MTTDDRRPPASDPLDALSLAEAVAAGRLSLPAAEAALREAHAAGGGRVDTAIDELHDVVAAIRGVRRHADAVRRADVEVFDPDATRAPFGSRAEDDGADRSVAPRRVRGDVHLRPTVRPRSPRWAPVGALAAAAVLVVAVALIGPGLLAPSVASTASPSASQVAVGSPSAIPTNGPPGSPIQSPSAGPSQPTTQPPTPSPTPRPTGVAGVPPIPSERLTGAPGIVYWTLTTEDRITLAAWNPDGSRPAVSFSTDTWKDPSRADGIVIERRVVVSPDGRRVAFAETDFQGAGRARLRVFAADGTRLWTDPAPTGQPDLAWSPDGSALVVGSQPATWKILTFGGSGAPHVVTRTFAGQAFRVLGFSTSGAVLYGWDTNGEAEYWQTPFQVVVPNGTPVSITRFSGKAQPLGVSNGTTAVTDVAPENGTSTQTAGVDPKTSKVLDTGGLSGTLNGWELTDGASHVKLDGLTMAVTLAWGPGGTIVIADVNQSDQAATIGTALPTDVTHVADALSIPAGSYWRLFEGSRAGFALLGLGAERAKDFVYEGAGELVVVGLASGRTAVFVPDDAGLIGLHIAGWITAP